MPKERQVKTVIKLLVFIFNILCLTISVHLVKYLPAVKNSYLSLLSSTFTGNF